MADRPRVPPIPYHRPESRPPAAVDDVGRISTPPPPQLDPEVERRFRAIDDNYGTRLKSLEDEFRGQKDGITAHVDAVVASAVDAKLTEKLGPLRVEITGEFTKQNIMLADISVFVKTIAKRMHGLAMESSAEFAPIDKRIDGKRKHRIATILMICTVVGTIGGLVAMAINSQRGQPVVPPSAPAQAAHH